MIIYLAYFIGNISYSDIDFESTLQVSAGLDSFNYNDWNYTGTAFLGYPSRQYILVALPSLLFGRNIYTLHIGYGYLFIIGLTLMFLEFRAWLKESGLDEQIALIPVYWIVAFRFIAEYYMIFEQTIIPVCITMMCIALFMRAYRKLDIATAINLSWIGCLCSDSYAPAIATLGLSQLFIVIYILKIKRDNHFSSESKKRLEQTNILKIKTIIGIEISITSFLVATLIVKRSDRIDNLRDSKNILKLAFTSWYEFFTDKNAVFFGIFSVIILVYMFTSLIGKLKLHDALISVWTLGVVFSSTYIIGYTDYEKHWVIQRNMIIIPVLVTGIFIAFVNILKKYKISIPKLIQTAVLIILASISIYHFNLEHQSFVYFKYVQPMKCMIDYSQKLVKNQGLNSQDEFNLVIITDNDLQHNITDYTTFFYLKAHAVATSSESSDECIQSLNENITTIIIGETKESVKKHCNKVGHIKYNNKRYKNTIDCYSGIIKNQNIEVKNHNKH